MEKQLQGERILLAEDEILIAMSVEQLCKEHGAEKVITVSHYRELSLSLVETHRISSAILDISLAGQPISGFARQLAEQEIPFIFATGYTAEHQELDDFQMIPIVEKPYREELLIATLHQAIRERQNRG